MIKLPTPLATEGVWYPNGTDKPGVVGDCYTEAQMLQFRRDALEEAALVCDALTQKAISSIAKSAFKVSANDIRKLKDET